MPSSADALRSPVLVNLSSLAGAALTDPLFPAHHAIKERYSRTLKSVNVISLQALLGNATWKGDEPLWERIANTGWIRRRKGQFVELKVFLAMPHLNNKASWVLRVDSDSVFVRPVHLRQHLTTSFAGGRFTLVHQLSNGTCGAWPHPANTSNDFLDLDDPRYFGYSLSSFWLFEPAVYSRFAAYVLASRSMPDIVAWIEKRGAMPHSANPSGASTGPANPLGNLLMTDVYYRYLLNIDRRRDAYRSVEADALMRARPLLRRKCGFRMHSDAELARAGADATRQIAKVYEELNGHLPTWVSQAGCSTNALAEFNVRVVNASRHIFLNTIASGCQDIIRRAFTKTAHWPPISAELPTTSGSGGHAHARKEDGRVALLTPLHPKDLPKLHTFLRSAHDFVADFEEVGLHIVVTSDAEIAVVRESLKGVSPK